MNIKMQKIFYKGQKMQKYLKLILGILLLSSTISALEISSYGGDARFYYGTTDNYNDELFKQEGASGQFALALDLDLNVSEGVKVNLGTTLLTTIGLENSLITYPFAGSTTKDQLWLDEVNFEIKLLKNTEATIGRQYISSPLLYSVDWNIVSNAMDGAYIVDKHLPKTKVMGFWIGREWSNDYNATIDTLNFAGNFRTFGEKGAYGVGAQTQFIPTVTAEFWYYDVMDLSSALWFQAESDISNFNLGAQFASRTPEQGDSISGYALRAKYSADFYSIDASFSQMSKDGSVNIVNLAGVYGDGSKSPLYTEAWWNWGYVGSADTISYALKTEATISDIYLGAYLTQTTNSSSDIDTTDFTFSANANVGKLNIMAVYIYITRDDYNNAEGYNTLQGYLTYNF